jgi:folate-binding protein YgfZ
MTTELFQQIESGGGTVDLSNRAKFCLTGNDRVRYLNGQVTNDVRAARPDESLYACVTDLKGRIMGDIQIHVGSDSLILDAEPDLRETLGPRLERYIIADDAELTDITEEWQLWHVFGPSLPHSIEGAIQVKSNRLGTPGIDLWLPASSPQPELHHPVLSAADYETYRILRGIPRCPNELNGDTFPPEAGIEATAMSYTKGCYIGQEVLSRIRTTGKMPRTLIRWTSDQPVATGDQIMCDGKPVGLITSAAIHPMSKQFVGLAFVKQGTPVSLYTSSGAPLIIAASV